MSVNSAEDADGNTQTESFSYISPFSKVTIDRTTPTVSSKTLTTSNSDNTKAFLNDILTLTVETNEEVTLPLATIAGQETNFVRDLIPAGNIEHDGTNVLLNRVRDVFIQGNYAYVVSADRLNNTGYLQIINITDKDNLTAAGNIEHDESNNIILNGARDVFVQGNYAYIPVYSAALGVGALQIIDITDKDNPTAAGNIVHNGSDVLLDNPAEVFVQGNYAYAVGNGALQIINITDKDNPTPAGNIEHDGTNVLLNYPTGAFVQGDYAYVIASDGIGDTDDTGYLQIINITDKDNPTPAGNIKHDRTIDVFLDGAIGIFVQGDYAYAVGDSLQIINITDKDNPTAVGYMRDRRLGGHIFVQGNYAYVVSDRNSGSLQVIDISDPSDPTLVGNIDDHDSPSLNGASGVFVQGDYAYVISDGDFPNHIGTLQVIELSNTYKSKVKIYKSTNSAAATYSFGKPVDASGNEGITTSETSLIIVDTAKTAPRPTIISLSSSGDNPRRAKSGDTITLTVTYNKEVINPGTVTAFSFLTSITLMDGTLPSVSSPSKTATYTFVVEAGTSEGGIIVSVSDAEDADGNTQSEIFSYISLFNEVMIDTTAPNLRTEMLTTSNSDDTKAFLNDILTLTVETNEEVALSSVDIAGKEENFARGILAAGNVSQNGHLNQGNGVFIQGSYAYVISYTDNALQIIDISDQSTPTVVGQIVHNGNDILLNYPIDVFVQGNYAYVVSAFAGSNSSGTLQIINITDKDNPTAAGNIVHNGSDVLLDVADTIFVQGDYAYVTSQGSDALQIIDIFRPINPNGSRKYKPR